MEMEMKMEMEMEMEKVPRKFIDIYVWLFVLSQTK